MLKFTAKVRTGQSESVSPGYSGVGVFGVFHLRATDIESVGAGPDNGACILTATRAYLVTETVEQVLKAMGYNS
jgi:hypothetical protein